MAISGRNSI